MIIKKEIQNDIERDLYFNGKLIFKKWLDQGYSIIFDHFTWEKYTEKNIKGFDLEETPSFYHVKCRLTLFSGEKGGRAAPVGNGFRPNHVFDYEENGTLKDTFIGDFQFGENHKFDPGTTKNVTARFLTYQPVEQYLNIGRKWWLHEGARKIGETEMIKIKLSEKE